VIGLRITKLAIIFNDSHRKH